MDPHAAGQNHSPVPARLACHAFLNPDLSVSPHLSFWLHPLARHIRINVSVGRWQKTAAFDAVFGVVPTPVQGVPPAGHQRSRGGTRPPCLRTPGLSASIALDIL